MLKKKNTTAEQQLLINNIICVIRNELKSTRLHPISAKIISNKQ